MDRKNLTSGLPDGAKLALCALLTVGVLILSHLNIHRWVALALGAVLVLLFALGDVGKLRKWPVIFLAGYGVFSMLTIFWALSGKFFLTHYNIVFIATALFLIVVLCGERERGYARMILGVLAAVAAVCAAFELAGAAFAPLGALLGRLTHGGAYTYDHRLSGVVGNANVEAAIHAMGVLLGIGLLCDSREKREKIIWSVSLFLNAVALLLGASLGALFFFALSVFVYLIFAGRGRSAALVRMLEGAALAAVFGAIMIRCYGRDLGFVVILLLLLGCAAAAVLELRTADKLSAAFAGKQKLTFGMLIAVIALAAAYLIVAMNVSGPYTFGAELSRGAELTPGEHVLSVEADGDVSVRITYYTEEQLMGGGTPAVVYEGGADGARFSLPEDAASVYLTFSGDEGVTLSRATVDDETDVILRYTLLPSFLANRFRGSALSGDVYQRFVYYRDSLRLAARYPLAGCGVGSFETALTSIQEYFYAVRYVHNHYLQILIEDGIIGLALFLAALVSMGVALWKKRRQREDGELFWLYPAFCAEFVMIALHMLWDVYMSITVTQIMVYVFFGLVSVLFAEPIPVKEKAPRGKGKKNEAASDSMWPARIALMVLPVFYMLSICGNIYAQNNLTGAHSSAEAWYASLERTVKFDLYEKNDIMLSYINSLMEDDEAMANHASKANEYAETLSKAHSNSLPAYLVAYYFNTEQYEKAIDEAMLGATYSLSDVNQWNTIADYLKQGFIDSTWASPLFYEERGEGLLDQLVEYKAVLDGFNTRTQKPLSVDANAREFFDKVAALDTARGNQSAMVDIMME